MRVFTIALVVLTLPALALGQAGVRGIAGYCPYGCGPFIPLVTTPSVSFQTVSSSPAGATNATGGLVAGARNSTLSVIPGNTDAVHTEVVWYSGGDTPLVSPAVRLSLAEPFGMRESRGERAERGRADEARSAWTYYAAREHTASAVEASAAARSGRKASRSYSNQDVERMNQQNGTVKHGGKTEHI